MRIHSPQITGSAANTNIVLTTVTASISVLSSSFAATASSADNLTVRGTLTAQTIVAQTITSSIEFITGSTRNGSLLTDIHQFTGSVGITGSLLVNGGGLAVQDGTILYHISSSAWFTPTGTVSTSGTTVTSIGTQFTSGMVGAKLTILGESRIITAFTSTTQVTVNSAYSQNYSGVALGSWAVYSKAFDIQSDSSIYYYNKTGTAVFGKRYDSNVYVNNLLSTTSDSFYLTQNRFALNSAFTVDWTNGQGTGTRDAGIRRNSAGLLEIYDGNTTDGAVANRRDLILRNITGSNATFSGSVTSTVGFTGSLFGTSSYAAQANSASYVLQAQSASYWSGSITNAATASYVVQAQSASYWSGSIINAATASYVLQAQSASYWSGSITNAATASYVLNAVSASYALTASYISGSGAGVGFPFSGSAIITGSLFVSGSTISGSFKGDGSQITGLTAGGKIFTQSSAASTWTVTHNLGVQYPNVTVYDNNNNVIIPQTIVATDSNTLTLTFGSAVAGYAVAGIGGIINVQGRTTQQYFTASTTWSFAHNLGDKYVSLQAFDDAFEMMIPTTIRLVDFTSSLLLFDSASSGYAVATIGGDLPAISSSYAGYTLQVASSAPYSASWVAIPNVTVTNAVSSSFAATASSADNLTVRGTLTAQTINVQTITSSIDFVTGSAKFGSLSTNIHQFTGSVGITGSAAALLNINNGVLYVSSSRNIGIGTITPDRPLDIYSSTVLGIARIRGNNSNGVALTIQNDENAQGISIYAAGTSGFGLSGWAGNTALESETGIVYSAYSGSHIFQNAARTERMRITSLGNIAVNTSTNYDFGNAGNRGITLNGNTGAVGYVHLSSNNTSYAFWYAYSAESLLTTFTSIPLLFGTNGTEKMRISANGSIGAGGSTTNIYNASDVRLKQNINPITYGLDIISMLNPVKFNWVDGFETKENGKNMLGFIAQEVQSVIPEAVESFGGNSITIGDTTIDNPLRVNEKFIIPVLVKAIQELSAKNTTLEERLTALENK